MLLALRVFLLALGGFLEPWGLWQSPAHAMPVGAISSSDGAPWHTSLPTASQANRQELQDAPATQEVQKVAVIETLNKITARTQRIQVPLHKMMTLGTLRFIVRHCYASAPEERPETAIFVQIWDNQNVKDAMVAPIFSGWMFASSLSLSSLEHSIYDMWPHSCSTVSQPAFESKE